MMNPKKEICNAFNKHASDYERIADVQHEIGERLFERLAYLKIQPRYVLDVGCGPGFLTKRLKKQYPKAQVVGLDLAHAMLKRAEKKQAWWKNNIHFVNADMTALPFASGQFDLVFSNQVIHWSLPLTGVIRELNRVLSPHGCLMFSTLGPDTFQELKQAFATVDSHAHVNDFPDMHDVGDCLLSERFIDPVMDMEILTAHYPTLLDLLRGLKDQGVRNVNPNRNPGLTGRQAWRQFEQAMASLCIDNQKYPLTYEVVYGHAWKGMQQRTEKGIETFISIDQLKVAKNQIR